MHVSRSTFHAFEGVTVHGREKEQRRLGELPKEGIQADYIGMEFDLSLHFAIRVTHRIS